MDPISQGVLGAVAACCSARKENMRLAALVGWAGGMLADADIFIRSSEDPLLNIEYHRHFSHSLAFIPIGGLVCALFFWALPRPRAPFKTLYLFATAGYATAGLLDACTSYGTQLYWPFSSERVSWSIISIVDPLFTGGLLVLTFLAWKKRARRFALGAALFVASYLSLGAWQNHRALAEVEELAASRGHQNIQRASVKPSIGNLVLWRGIYEHEGRFFVDAVRVGWFSPPRAYPGPNLEVVTLDQLSNDLDPDSALADDLQRFAHFSEDYLAWSPNQPNLLIDLRYSAIPNSSDPLWGIEIDRSTPDRHAPFRTFREVDDEAQETLLNMLMGKDL